MRILNSRFNLAFVQILLFASVVLFSNCGGKGSNSLPEKFNFSKVSTIKCSEDTTQSYSLYLPSSFDNKKQWPLIFLYDPHGNGNLSIENFKEAAERYGYILVGSNNSRNGVAGTEDIIGKLVNDVFSKFPIDKQRIYAAGFSGGARVALNQALMMSNIKGIMMAGASANRVDFSSHNHKFDIYATAGLGDFNYLEVTSIQEQLQGLGWRFMLREFEGGHAWPPKEVINEAVLWFTLNAMRDKVIAKEETLIDKVFAEERFQIDSLIDAGHLVAAEQAANNAVSLLKKLSSTKKLEHSIEKIKKMPEYKAEMELRSQSFNVENEWKQGLINSFTSKDTAWWRKQLAELELRINSPGDVYSRQMFMRVKGFLGIVAYTFTNDIIMRNQMDQAQRLISIYQIIEPANADVMFFKAIMLDRQNKTSEALSCVKKARKLGFSDWKKFNEVASSALKEGISRN
ncbi:MAG TPA: hypothetical protein VHO72_05190 [Bacteroidales bacterium]|nr:hypothetical protein [Bacteroidales bacterium]